LIYNIIAKRIANEAYFNSVRNLERVTEMYIKTRVKNEELLNAIYKKIIALELKYISIPMIDLFIKNNINKNYY
jgi:hypothetical protein